MPSILAELAEARQASQESQEATLPKTSQPELPTCQHRGPEIATRDSLPVFVCNQPTIVEATPTQCHTCGIRELPRQAAKLSKLSILVPPPRIRQGPQVRRWAIGITTAPRRQVTLHRCVETLRASGFEDFRVFAEPDSPLPDSLPQLTQHRDKIGCWPNYYLTFHELLLRNREADAFAIFQDDTEWPTQHNLREYLEQALWPTWPIGAVSLYTSQVYQKTSPGWHLWNTNLVRGRASVPTKWVWGACAFIFPRESLVKFLQSDTAIKHRLQGRAEGIRNIDIVIGQWARKSGMQIWVPEPSLCQHIGETSTLWKKNHATGRRAASKWVGGM